MTAPHTRTPRCYSHHVFVASCLTCQQQRTAKRGAEAVSRSALVLAEAAATQAKTSAVLAASYALDAKRGRR